MKRIVEEMRYRPGESIAQFPHAARSLYWMLAAAGIDAEGGRGVLRVPGLMSIYARVFDIWLDDDDTGLARTMAALDSRLRRGERVMQRIDDFGATAARFCSSILSSARGRRNGEPHTDETPEPAAPAPTSSPTNGSGEPGTAPAL